ncbi:MAG: hypothetical protein KDD45_16770 [Bdellovibrionales bacterium]|nr:hypothetical protein [Bdellovibrionales bacterium]
MENHKLLKFIFILLLCTLPSCISIGLSKSAEPAKDVRYTTPKSPFKEHNTKTGDRVWLSQETGNTLSYISDCSVNTDPSLESIESDALSGIENLKIISTQKQNYNDRESLDTTAEGQVDGVSIRIEVISLKKNSCNYNIIYAGKVNNFEKEISYFKNFKESFNAP